MSRHNLNHIVYSKINIKYFYSFNKYCLKSQEKPYLKAPGNFDRAKAVLTILLMYKQQAAMPRTAECGDMHETKKNELGQNIHLQKLKCPTVCSELTTNDVKHYSREEHFVLGPVRSTNVSALHPDKATYYSKQSKTQRAHEQSPHCLDVIC